MSGFVIVIAIGVLVAGFVAFAVNLVMPGGGATSTEDRLAAMASRRRDGRGDAGAGHWTDSAAASCPAGDNRHDGGSELEAGPHPDGGMLSTYCG